MLRYRVSLYKYRVFLYVGYIMLLYLCTECPIFRYRVSLYLGPECFYI